MAKVKTKTKIPPVAIRVREAGDLMTLEMATRAIEILARWAVRRAQKRLRRSGGKED